MHKRQNGKKTTLSNIYIRKVHYDLKKKRYDIIVCDINKKMKTLKTAKMAQESKGMIQNIIKDKALWRSIGSVTYFTRTKIVSGIHIDKGRLHSLEDDLDDF